jgi:hypothetical protein
VLGVVDVAGQRHDVRAGRRGAQRGRVARVDDHLPVADGQRLREDKAETA